MSIPKIPPALLTGTPIPPEMHQLFGNYAGSPVKGLVAMEAGVVVDYEDGTQLLFRPERGQLYSEESVQ